MSTAEPSSFAASTVLDPDTVHYHGGLMEETEIYALRLGRLSIGLEKWYSAAFAASPVIPTGTT